MNYYKKIFHNTNTKYVQHFFNRENRDKQKIQKSPKSFIN